MTCLVFPDRATCPASSATQLAVRAWAGVTGAVGAAAVCPHTPDTTAWQPADQAGYSRTLSCTICGKSQSVTTPEDHRGCA